MRLCLALLVFNQCLDLTSQIRSATENLANQIRSWAENLTYQHRDLFGAAWPLADRQHLIRGQGIAIHHPALEFELGELFRLDDFSNFLREANEILATQTTASEPD